MTLPSQWVSTKELCTGLGVSRTTLSTMLREQIFEPGTDFYRAGLGKRSPMRWDLESCRTKLRLRTAADPASFERFDL